VGGLFVRAALAALVGVAAAARPGQATSVAELGLDEAVRSARAIVRARVLAAEESWGVWQDAPAIVTTWRLAEEAPLLGARVGEVRAFGGTVSERTMTLEGQPHLTPGSEVVLLLCPADLADGPFVGVWQGAYELREGRVYRGERAVVDVVAGRVLLARDGEPAMRAEAFLAELAAAVERVAADRPAPPALPAPDLDRPALRPLDPWLGEALRRREAARAAAAAEGGAR
jgi:hypothetical protein